jgi:uncharacterized Zn-finger protein
MCISNARSKRTWRETLALPAPIRYRKATQFQERQMAGHSIPHFQNDAGHARIEIGVKEFMCVGATPPLDHPHIFIDMGDDEQTVCSYCSTLYAYNPRLKPDETKPAGCLYITARAA